MSPRPPVSGGDAELPPAVLLMGPTAAGKTAVALALAKQWPIGLISVDSAQVYRGMDIGSAKPDAGTLAKFPHALIDIREPEETYSAADFVAEASKEMRRIAESGRLPVLVGGTMLYHRALLSGLDSLPAADPDVRARLDREAAEHGWPALHQRLERLDPEASRRIRPNDPQRIQRALEVVELSGRPYSDQLDGGGIRRGWPTLRLVVAPPDRRVLHERISQRLHAMLGEGFLDEVERLMARPGLGPGSPSMRAVGYRQAWRYLAGEIGRDRFFESARAATRQLAKRQITWLRQMPDSLWYNPLIESTIRRIVRRVEVFQERLGQKVDP